MILDYGEFIPQICCSLFLFARHAMHLLRCWGNEFLARFMSCIIASGKKDANELVGLGV